jgi:hypothetical protein
VESLSGPEKQRALEVSTWWCVHCFQEHPIHEELLTKLGFGSVEALRLQLKNWGLPDWLINPREGDKVSPEGSGEFSDERERRARQGDGEAKELPPAVNAAALFKEELETLCKAADQLGMRREYLKDERFVVEYVEQVRLEATPPVSFPGPATRRTSLGASQYPPEPLTMLIACYALSGLPLDPLLTALHPNASEKVKQQAGRDQENLRREARRLARRVRGGTVRTGRTTGEVSPEEMRVAWWVQLESMEGHSAEHIRDRLSRINVIPAEFPIEEIRRLRSLDLPFSPG